MGFHKILVAVDRSLQAEAVFEQALDLAQKEGAKLKVFNCISFEAITEVAPMMGTGLGIDPSEGMASPLLQQDRMAVEIEQAQALLDTYYQRAVSVGTSAECDYKVGDPASLICEAASNWEADLIVISRTGRTVLSEILLGSISNHVIHNAPCSVLLVQ